MTININPSLQGMLIQAGTWQSNPEEVQQAVTHALLTGYRHIDAAFGYQNEEEVGKGLRDAFESGKVRREDVFVTTKLWCTYHTQVGENLELSLKNLGLDYVDLYLMHWPLAMNPNGMVPCRLHRTKLRGDCWFLMLMAAGNHPLFPKLSNGNRDIVRSHSHVATYKSMEKLLETGKVKAIGVCNYSKRYLEELLPQVSVIPAVNQIENHPALPQQEIVDFCKEQGIHITAYSPLGSIGGPLFTIDAIAEVSKRRNVSPALVLLSWHSMFAVSLTCHLYVCLTEHPALVARGSSVLSKSVTPSHIDENRNLIKLDESDIAIIARYTDELAAKKAFQRFVYPPFGIDFGFPDKS
jgi:glycerol 2-dehydrogenase (NADP+)